VAMVKNADGTVTARARAADGTVSPNPVNPADPAAPKVEGTPQTPEGKIKIGDVELGPGELQELLAEKALRDSRKATMPANADGYKLELSKDTVLPEGTVMRFDAADPLTAPAIKSLREFSHLNGLNQEQFGRLLGIYSQHQIHEQRMLLDAHRAEVRKLGEYGNERIGAVSTFIRGMVGDDLAKPLLQMLLTEKSVTAFEKLMHRTSQQGGSSGFSNVGREPGKTTISQDDYDRLSYSQKKAYAESHQQQQR
jgi:hypothetical protein